MSFRLISKPLDKRGALVQPPIKNELIVDNVHGMIGIATTNKDNELVYNSGLERNKADLDSLKIRNKNSNDNLLKISFGSENNVNIPGFDINKAIEDKDILGSLEYIYKQYSNFIDEIDENENVILKDNAFDFEKTIKEIAVKLYSMDINSYSDKFRDILSENFSQKLSEEYKEEVSDNFSYLTLQKNVLDCLEIITKLDSQVTIFEKIIDTLLLDVGTENSSNLDTLLNNIDIEIDELLYNTKTKKFKDFNIDSAYNINNQYRTEDNDLYKITENNNKNIYSSSFDENFPNSILDENFDGDINQYKIDSIYNNEDYNENDNEKLKRMTGNYFLDLQNYYYLINTPKSVVYDPIEKKPIFKIKSLKTASDDNDNEKIMYNVTDYNPSLNFYLDDNNLLLQTLFLDDYKSNITLVNSESIKDLLFRNYELLNREEILESKIDDLEYNIKNQLYYFPSIYNLGAFSQKDKNYFSDYEYKEIFKENLDFNYFLGSMIYIPTTLQLNATGQYIHNYVIRDSFTVYNKNYEFDDLGVLKDSPPTDYNYLCNTNRINEKYNIYKDSNKQNNSSIMCNNYYSGYGGYNNSYKSFNDIKNDFNNYIDNLNNKLNTLGDNIINDKILFPTFFGTSLSFNYNDENIFFKFDERINYYNTKNHFLYIMNYDNKLYDIVEKEIITENPENKEPENNEEQTENNNPENNEEEPPKSSIRICKFYKDEIISNFLINTLYSTTDELEFGNYIIKFSISDDFKLSDCIKSIYINNLKDEYNTEEIKNIYNNITINYEINLNKFE